MLEIKVKATDLYDDLSEEFVTVKAQVLTLEHSLISVSKWEALFTKPFLSKTPMSVDETLSYIQCMTIGAHVDPNVYRVLPKATVEQVQAYISAPMTATTFNRRGKGGSREVITSEIIYYWMIALGIPFECERWHLNRLLTLIEVCDLKNSPGQKMPEKDVMAEQRRLNAERKRKYNTRG